MQTEAPSSTANADGPPAPPPLVRSRCMHADVAVLAALAARPAQPTPSQSLSSRLGLDAFEVCLSQLHVTELRVAMRVSKGWRVSARRLLGSPLWLSQRFTLRQLLLLLPLRESDDGGDGDGEGDGEGDGDGGGAGSDYAGDETDRSSLAPSDLPLDDGGGDGGDGDGGDGGGGDSGGGGNE